MKFFQNHKLEIFVLLFLVFLYFLSRFYSILALPIFTDEAIYIRWAQIAKQDANWRFISLTDGKQPMFVWIAMIIMRFINDPLLAGRLVSVGAGFFTLIGVFFLGKEIFKNNKIGLLSSALYVIFPMALVYDRMALYDSLVGTFAVWSMFFIIQLARTIRLDIALLLGMTIGAGVLTKTSGFFSIYLLPLSLLLFDWKRKKELLKWFFLAGCSVILVYLFYSILRLSPFFHIINEKNAIFVYPFNEWIKHPFYFLIGNSNALWDWTVRYLTWPLLVLSAASFFVAKSFLKEKILLFLYFFIPICGLAIFGNTLYPRFIFFMTLFLLPLISYSLMILYSRFKKRYLFVVFYLFILSFPITTDYFILNDFSHAQIPSSDIHQYKTDWSAGGGVRESVEILRQEAEKGKIYIATQGTFGLMPFSYEIYLVQNPNVTIEGFWPISDEIPQKVLDKSKIMPTYFVFYQACVPCAGVGLPPERWKSLDLIYQYEKDYGKKYLSLYKVKP